MVQSEDMSRNLWEDDSTSAATANASATIGAGGDASVARKAMFPAAIGANLWMSRGEDAWTTDTPGLCTDNAFLLCDLLQD